MSKVIKGGTIVAADRSYQADVLIEGEKIVSIGENLSGDTVIDAEGALIMPGGITRPTITVAEFMSLVVPWPGDGTGYINLHYSMPNRKGGKDIVTGKPFSTPDELISYVKWALDRPDFKEMWYCTSLQSSPYRPC